MDARMTTIAQTCRLGSYDNSMSFPDVVAAMMAAGFESCFVDSRTNTRAHYLPDGEALVLPNP